MPDIFGMIEDDYKIIQDKKSKGEWDKYQASNAELRKDTSLAYHDFNALGAGAPEGMPAAAYLAHHAIAIQTYVDDVLLRCYRLPMFVAINTNIPEGTKSFGVRVRGRKARNRSERITGPGYHAPTSVGRGKEEVESHPLHWYGLDADWSADELHIAMAKGSEAHPLDTDPIDAAVMGSVETIEAIALTGNNFDSNTRGLCNQLDREVHRQIVADDGNMTAVIRNEIASLLQGCHDKEKEGAGQCIACLPGALYDSLGDMGIADLSANNPWTDKKGDAVIVHRVLELSAAYAKGLSYDRIVTTVIDPIVAQMGVSIMPRVLNIKDKGNFICAQVESKCSAYVLQRPESLRYVDLNAA